MNGRPQVSIRLGTTGRSDVEQDFAAIGDSGDAAAKRYQAAWERASANAEAALERQAKAAARLQTVSATPVQQQINVATGVSGIANDTGAARASAAAFAQQLDQADAAAKRLLASVDPLFGAQMRYNQALDEAIGLQKIGILSEQQFATVKSGLKAQYDEQVQLLGHVGEKSGTARLAQMEFMHVVRGSADALAAGAPPMQVFAMHLGMLSQAAQLAGGSMGAVGRFLGSGWGLALTVGVAVLGPMITKLIDTGNATDDLVDKLKKEAHQARDNQTAHLIFAQSLDGVTDAERRNEDALKKLSDQHESAAQKTLAGALANIENTKTLRDNTAAQLANAQSVLAVMKAQMSGPGHQAEVAAFGFPQQEALIAQLQSNLAVSNATIAKETDNVLSAMSHLSVEAMAEANDAVGRIKTHYSGMIDQARQHAEAQAKAARAAGDEAKAQQLVGTALKEQIAQLQVKENAEIKAAEAANRKGPANAGGTAIFDSQIASFFDIANRYRGDSETGAKGVLEGLFSQFGIKAPNGGTLDPEKVAWCAAFVNAVLASGGVHGSGSLAARSFLNYGKDDTHSPQKGDIVVVKSSGSPSGEHVGFLESIDARGNVRVLGGNTGNKVGTLAAAAKDVLAIRRPPTPSEDAAYQDKAAQEAQRAADKAAGEQTTFDGQLSKLHEQYLAALQKTLQSADDSASAQLNLAQAQHDAEAQQIADNLAQGKYGEATSQLAKARATQLQAANDAALTERQAAIKQADFVKSSERQQALADRRYQYALDDLKFADQFARSSDERRANALQMVQIEYEQKRVDLEALHARQVELLQFEKAAETQAAIDRLPLEQSRAQTQAAHSTMSPWDQYLDQLPQTWGEVRDAIEKDGVEALQDFTDGLAEAIVQGKSLGDVLHNAFQMLLTDLIKLGEQEALSALFGAGGSAARGNGGGGGGLLGGIMSLFGGGGGSIGAADLGATMSTSFDTSIAASLPGGFASGTEYFSGGTAWVGEHGPELVRLPRGSKISTAADSRRMMAAANDARIGAVHIPISIDATGADAAGLARVQGELQQLRASLPGLVNQAWVNANDRFAFRGSRR